MAPLSQKKRKVEDGMRGKTERPKKRIRKQLEYHSSSDEDEQEDQGFTPVNLEESDEEQRPTKTAKSQRKKSPRAVAEDTSDIQTEDEDEDEDTHSEEAATSAEDSPEESLDEKDRRKHISKRNDPEAFSTSISKILSTKLSQSARKDPVLSRSKEAAETSVSLANDRLEQKAKAKLRSDRKEELERGRVKDVLGLSTGQAGEVAEEEKRLRKIAQRGVVKLFNAVRAAQVKAEQVAKEERKKGTIGMANREEKVNEMSKQGFLDLIAGKKNAQSTTAQ
ncbi:uncharacterized protein Z520_10115 [Fonsecaea multimorphosa CBS 102226]|uniref:Rrp15p-domain-containing protein n=1 Tax=Fonsecaea multimorphosa CBS 102226 TaxID=1442371 RepID=A0A0D2JUB1_9EURO|nr:uncharacterized protein Z520_10115 [Fonsecaea multimorphosa CBS 102226]KIX94089.1 hypothetical protein Z520_10115 [Fonsecaea multimorphosa CBS 102226]OAL19442.1 hypothetical protein AYO22_09604 [Fonsecaea multimorphosa]